MSASKSIVNTLFFITSENKDQIDLKSKKYLGSKKRMIFSKNKKSMFSKFLGYFKLPNF